MLVEERKDEIPYCHIYLRSEGLLAQLVAGTRATEGAVLLLKEEEVLQGGMRKAVKDHQIRAVRISAGYCDNPFNELCRLLLSFR